MFCGGDFQYGDENGWRYDCWIMILTGNRFAFIVGVIGSLFCRLKHSS